MSAATQTISVRVPDVPDWVCALIAEVAHATGTDHGTATRLALVEGLLLLEHAAQTRIRLQQAREERREREQSGG